MAGYKMKSHSGAKKRITRNGSISREYKRSIAGKQHKADPKTRKQLNNLGGKWQLISKNISQLFLLLT